MTLFQTLEGETRTRGLGFLIIGAHAINQYGYSRDTSDLDLLIRRTDRESWIALFSSLNYRLQSFEAHEAGNCTNDKVKTGSNFLHFVSRRQICFECFYSMRS